MTDDAARCERLARAAVGRWLWKPDADDILQEARIAAWQHRDRPDPVVVTIARRRATDAHRRWHGGRRHTRPVVVPLDGHEVATDTDELRPSDSWGVPGRLGFVADALAAGHLKQDIARRLNVSPGRVSQLIAELRELVA